MFIHLAFVCFLLEIDERILRTVAREHPTDADEAAAVVISEVVPLFPQEWEVHVPKRKLHHLPLCKGTLLALNSLDYYYIHIPSSRLLALIGLLQ